MANKMVEMTFAIGAALTGSFSNTFGKASKALGELQKQSSQLQQVSGQIDGYQKMNDAITKNQAAMVEAQNQAKALETQITSSAQKTAMLKSQYGEVQAEVERLNAVLVRNKDAYRAAQLNVQSLERQIRSSKTPNAELQRQYAAAQAEARRLGEAVKRSGAEFQQAQAKAKRLNTEMRTSASQTRTLKTEARTLNAEAEKLKGGIERDSEALSRLQRELSGAGVDTSRLASEQARLTQQSQRLADAQTRLQNSRAALQATREKLSWSNIKGDFIKSAGIGYSLYKPTMIAADFEQAMARTKAVAFTGKNKTPEQKAADDAAFKALQAQALQLGADTQFTAIQAAQSQEMLARAGFKSNEIIAAMPGLLDMAAAEGMDLATAADIAASTLRGFNLDADQSGRVADVLAQMSAASNTSIAALGDSMKYVAPIASGLGVSIEETSAMLGVMANAGIKGSESGTALRNAFLRLSKEPKEVEKALNSLGIAATDSQGRMRKMPGLMRELYDKMKNMGESEQMRHLSNIFGQRSASGMLAVMRASVDGTLKEYEMLGYEATGVISKMAEMSGVKMEEMRANLKSLEPALGTLGLSFQETSIMMAILAKSGIKNSDATLALTETYRRLTKEPKQVQKALKGMNISLYDSNKKMKNLPALMDELQKAMAGMSEADQIKSLTEIFGVAAAPAIMKMIQGLADGTIEEYRKAANEATGISHDMAETMQDTLRGQMTIAGSAIEGLMIEIGNVIAPYAKIAVYWFTRAISGITKFLKEHPIAKSVISWVAGLSALSIGITALKYSWLAIKLPFQSMRVAMDLLNAKTLENAGALAEAGKKAGLFSKLSGKISAGAKGIGNMFKAIGSGIWKMFSSLMNVGKSLISGLFSPMGLKIMLIGGIIAGVAAAAYLIYKNWDKIKAWWNSWTLKDVFAPVIGFAQKAWAYVKQLWSDFWTWWDSWTIWDVFAPVKGYVESAKEYAKQKWADLQAWWDSWTFADVFAPVKEYAGLAKDYAMQKLTDLKAWWDSWTLNDVFSPVLEKGRAVLEKFSSTIETVKNLASEKLSSIWDKTVTAYEQARSVIVGKVISPVLKFSWNALVEGWNVASGLVSAGFEKLKGLLHIDFSGFWDTLSSGFATVCDSLKGAWNGVTGFIKDTWNTASDYVSGAWKWTKSLFGYDTNAEDLQTQIQDITALNKMSEGFTQRVAEMTAAWQPFKDSLGEGFEEIYSVMQGIADRIRSVVIPAVNELTSALSKIATEISSIVQAGDLEVEVKTQGTGTAESYSRTARGTWKGRKRAAGGFINHPEIALIGEAGREAVIPLENKARGIPLWKAAGEEMGLLFGNTTNNDNRSSAINFSPSYNITVNGGDPETERRFRQIIEETLADMMSQAERISFA